MDYRSPLNNVFSFISGLPQGHDKPIKHALYNALALLVLFLCCASGYALFVILGPFIKPLVWALLLGSVLHPLKCLLTNRFRQWFHSLEKSHTPAVIALVIVPINITNDVSEFIGSKLLKYLKAIIAVAIAIPLLHVVYYYTPKILIALVWQIAAIVHTMVNFIVTYSTTLNISVVLIGYITLMISRWTPSNNKLFHYASIAVWLLLSCCLANQFGPSFQTPVFLALQIIFAAGFFYEAYDIYADMVTSEHQVTIVEALYYACEGMSTAEILELKNVADESDANQDTSDVNSSQEESTKESVGDSNKLRDISKTDEDGGNTQTTTLSSSAENKQISIKEKNETSKSSKTDPWSLELFEDPSPKTKYESNKTLPLNKTSTPVDTASNTGLLITDKGKIHVLAKSKSNTNLRHRFKRSMSVLNVPTQMNLKSRVKLLNTTFAGVNQQCLTFPPIEYASDFYVYSLLWLCGIMIIWKNVMLLPILTIPVFIYLVKHLGIWLGLWDQLYEYYNKALSFLIGWCCERIDAFIPVPIRGLYKVTQYVNEKLKIYIKDSLDTVASSVVILGLMIFVVCASIFIALQIYAEGIMLVQMTSNVINQTVVHNPELRQLLPPSIDDTVDSVLDNAYQYGRQGISKAIRGMMTNVESEKSAKLEQQVLDLWDRIYQSWMSSSDSHGPKVTGAAVMSTWEAFITDVQKSPELFNFHIITDFVKQNIDTFVSLLESVWSIIKGNINLIMSSLSALLSILLGGGTAVLNFILNVIVFLTTLFYLLNSSSNLYKPVELMTNFSPSQGTRLGLALEAAINGVFIATFKMAAFYGMWTWFIHNLFNVKIVYLPSALAAILGAVPFLGTYWAGIPAVLDLWLAQDRGFQAVLFAIFQFLPTSVVDTTIYNEIQGGGHPYLTGLAIAGGIFCLGVEGAIIGPLLLCGLYVVIDLSSHLFRDSPAEESIELPNLSRLEIEK